jgi:gamma-glutamylcyclotransferase (GGCT)/AIG2-like uncharacterized protein YtfP
MNKKNLYAFYGSLRVGEYNYNRLLKGQPGVTYITTTTLPKGFLMYSLGPYPIVTKSELSTSPLVVDIFEIENDYVANFIDMMEIGAGYEKSTVCIEDYNCIIYVGYYSNSTNIVASGDWSKELKRRADSKNAGT